MPIKALLLDLDGTLIDSRADLASAVNHTLKDLGYPEQSLAEIVPRIGNGLRQLLRDSIGLSDPDILLKAKQTFETYYGDHCLDESNLYEGVSETLEFLSDKVKLAVVTNKPFAFAEKILISHKLKPYMSVVLGGDSLPQAKPEPEPLLSALKSMGIESSSALMVGDGPQDLHAGQAAGVKTCMVRYGFGFHQELMKLKPDFAIHKFSELKEIVR